MIWKLFFDILYYTLTYGIFLYSLLLSISFIFLGLYSIGETKDYLHKNKFTDYRLLASSEHVPSVSMLAPAYNEGKTIVENVRSLLAIFYTNLEIIVINDGSKDDSLEKLIKEFDLVRTDHFVDYSITTKEIKGIYKSRKKIYKKLIVIDKENGGKADALNAGINISSKSYFICIDVDCILEQDALLKMVKPFMEQTNKRVIATGGVIRVANSCEVEQGKIIKVRLAKDYLPRMQILEYIRAFILGRMAWSRLNGLLIISGAFGAFDKEIAIAAGGYNPQTVGEDMELVVRMRRYMEEQKLDYVIRYIPDPLCWTEVPNNYAILERQRNRWFRGTFQTLKIHRIMFFNPRYRILGMVSYPYWFIFELCAPIIEFFGFFAFICFAITGYIDWSFFFVFFFFIICFAYLYSLFAILMEVYSFNQYKRRVDIFRLLLTALSEPFYFHPFIVWSGIRGLVNLIVKENAWGEMTRQGFSKGTKKSQNKSSASLARRSQNSLVKSPLRKREADKSEWIFADKILPVINKIISFISDSIRSYLPLALVFGLLILSARFFEFIADYFKHGAIASFPSVFLIAISKDFLYWIITIAVLLPVFMLVYLIHKKTAQIIFIFLSIALLLVQVSLSQYFLTTLVPLGSDLWGYSTADIKQTLGAAGGVPTALIFAVIVLLIIAIGLFVWLPKKLKMNETTVFVFVFILGAIFITPIARSITKWMPGQEYANNLTLNKSYYFFNASIDHFLPATNETDIYADSYQGGFQKANSTEQKLESFSYVDEKNFPFLHNIDSAKDVLSPFFNKSTKAPNIVIILVEGLGRAFTNNGAYLGNFTPSVDSLASKSLYWENFLSEGGRTFAALPSILSSITFAKNGFNELGENMPKHFSLLNLLQQNGYKTSFYYGGDAHFDNMNIFLTKNGIYAIRDGATFPAGVAKMPQSASGFSWGYGDKQLFDHYLNTNTDTSKPSMSLILTVSTHSPFKINDQEKYLQRFEERMTELHFNESLKKEYRNYSYQYASILYTDEKIGEFIRSYQKRPDYNNTVFLITGDHRMPEIPMSSKIDRYHVPLLIYSPLLKRTAKFSSVSTHFDITPSLLAWLKHSYQMQVPEMASWMGGGLDTSRTFRNTHAYPLMQTKTEIIDFVQGNWLVNSNTLFRINEKMELTQEDNPAKANELKANFDRYKFKNNQFISNLKILPDSLLLRYLR
jgi:cellulose synthase/poly-beta-1,6-N-acetylglucosamine synthase-like glycosyltransferase/phosphoglycerol transferase MdoB-like AlkP superfamily enzyme